MPKGNTCQRENPLSPIFLTKSMAARENVPHPYSPGREKIGNRTPLCRLVIGFTSIFYSSFFIFPSYTEAKKISRVKKENIFGKKARYFQEMDIFHFTKRKKSIIMFIYNTHFQVRRKGRGEF